MRYVYEPTSTPPLGGKKALVFEARAFSCLKVGDPPRDRTGNLLIKSYSVNVFRRTIRCCIVLQLNLRTLKNTQQQAVNRGKLGAIHTLYPRPRKESV